MKSLFESTQEVLFSKDIEQKTQGTQKLKQDFEEGKLNHEKAFPIKDLVEAGYPSFLNFVAPKDLPRRRLGSPLGKVALLHSLAHIEFNAINLALDAVYRFQQMPNRYYADWLKVAADEARHFQLLQGRLIQLGSAYGEFPVHSGLWEMAENTAHDVLVRMALVPRVMEARGLDVTPGMVSKLRRNQRFRICPDTTTYLGRRNTTRLNRQPLVSVSLSAKKHLSGNNLSSSIESVFFRSITWSFASGSTPPSRIQ